MLRVDWLGCMMYVNVCMYTMQSVVHQATGMFCLSGTCESISHWTCKGLMVSKHTCFVRQVQSSKPKAEGVCVHTYGESLYPLSGAWLPEQAQ